MRQPARPPSLAALRARRQALHIARDVAYPELKLPTPAIPVINRARTQPRPTYHGAPQWQLYEDAPPEPAPWWFKGVFSGAILIIAGAFLAFVCAR